MKEEKKFNKSNGDKEKKIFSDYTKVQIVQQLGV